VVLYFRVYPGKKQKKQQQAKTIVEEQSFSC
jgi:hypothetical protein